MSRIHFIGGEKGGVGKSMTARLLAQYFIDHHQPFIGFDSDRSHNTFSRFYGEFAAPLSVSEYHSLDGLIETAEANPNHEIIVDLAAQTNRFINKWIEESDAFELFEELGHQPVLWHVMDDSADSLGLLSELLLKYPEATVPLIVVQNMGRGEDFEHLKTSIIWQQALDRPIGVFVLNKLQSPLAKKIDFNSFSFWAAANSSQDMSLPERKRVAVWLKKNYQQLADLLAIKHGEALEV